MVIGGPAEGIVDGANAECDGDREAVTALCDGGEHEAEGFLSHTNGLRPCGEDDEISLGDTVYLEGVLPTVEVAMFTHGGDSVVLETVGSDHIRQYIIPKAAIENGHIAVPA